MAEERVVLTAELKDQMSAPLATAARRVEGFTDAVESGARRQATATNRATSEVTGALGRQNRLFSGMTGVVGRATTGTSRLFGTMRSSITRSMDGVASHATLAGERAGTGFGNGLKKAGALVATYFGAQMVGGFIAEAGRASDATDKFVSTMSFAGLDTSAIVKAKDDAKAFADQTVYDLPTIQQTMASLAANGVKNYTDITQAAGNLNAVAGGNAETFKSVSRSLSQSAGAGKLMTEDWNMLADAIPGASGQLQKAMREAGAFEGNFKKAMEGGEITADEFQAAIIKLGNTPIAEEAAKSTKTFEGALGNLNATINSGLMKALDAIKPAATVAIGALSNGLGKAIEWTGDAAQGLYDLFVKGDFTGAFTRAFNVEEDSPAVDVLFDIRDAAIGLHDLLIKGDYSGLLRDVFGWEEDSKAVDMLLDLRDAAIEVPGKLKDVATAIWDMRTPIGVIVSLIVVALIPHWVALGIEALKSAAKQKLAWAITRAEAVKAAFAHSGAVMAMIGGWVLMGAQATIQAVKIAAAWLIAMGPVGWIVAGIAALVGAFVWAYNNVDWFRAGVDSAMKWVGDAVKAATDWIVGAWNNVVDWWNSTLMPAIDAVGRWFGDLFTNVGNWARDFVGFFVDGWGMLVDFFNGVLMPAVQAVGDFFAPVFDWIGRLVWNFATIAVALFNRLVDLWNGVLLPALQNLGNGFMSLLTWIYNTIVKPIVDLVVGAFRGIVDFWNGVLIPAFQAVGNFFMTVGTWIYTTIILPIVNLIVGAFNGIVNFWNGVLLPALQWLGEGFMTVLNWIYNTIVKPVIDLLVGAFGMLTDFWNNTLKPVIDTVGKWFSEIIGGAISGVKSFIDDLVKGFQIMMTFIGDKLTPVIDGIRGTFEDLGRIIGDVLGKIGEFMNNPLGGIQDWLGIEKDGNGQGKMPGASGGGVFSGGGVVEAAFAGGGVLGGYSPGNDSILARLSPGESVLVPELTRAIGPQKIMAANAAASGGRKAGSGPSMTSGYSRTGRSSGPGLTISAPVQITVQGGADGVDYAALKAAVNEAFEDLITEHNRRAY
ncbi:tape measure protein [Arthrobacter phage Vibaki]|uniref:Tape measure protein n=1 Tax=Arthrobacter phage Vibaki TaxID=2593333 RepID=A0A514TZ22_9CAUD|nr:tail length tape measure protein [Arthrobacter phage Vibaki]QDK01900.1 tape measure protein [Arthrobacter phage Vibaki]